MSKTWRFVGNTHTQSLAGPDQAESPAPPRGKVAVAGPPFVVIIMALRCRCPSPLRIERGHLNRPAEQPRKTRYQAHKNTHATPADATHHRQKPTAAYAPEMIIRRWWRGLAHPHTQATPTSRRLGLLRGQSSSCFVSLHRWPLPITVTEIHREIACNARYRIGPWGKGRGPSSCGATQQVGTVGV